MEHIEEFENKINGAFNKTASLIKNDDNYLACLYVSEEHNKLFDRLSFKQFNESGTGVPLKQTQEMSMGGINFKVSPSISNESFFTISQDGNIEIVKID